MSRMDLSSWAAQLRKGAAELAVMSLVAARERYGLEILEGVNKAGEIVSEGALYPLLSRLEREGRLSSRWVTDQGSHPRKYYQLTSEGAAALPAMTAAWCSFSAAMNAVVEQQQ